MSNAMFLGGGEEDEEVLQNTYDTGITDRNLRYSKVVANITIYTFLV